MCARCRILRSPSANWLIPLRGRPAAESGCSCPAGDRHGVAAGGRRLAALNMLAERGIIPADWPVRVKIIPQELASGIDDRERSSSGYAPAEQIAGFCAMAQEGKTPAQIGDLLGYSPRHVQRMLKLADLAPVILDALAEDLITTEHCQALALENDTARQVQVFEAACQSGWGGKPEVQTIPSSGDRK